MKIHPETRTRILVDQTLGIDPDGSTVEVKVDAAWYPAEWLGEATTGTERVGKVMVARWYRTARTVDYFCGPEATPLGATQLDLGRHLSRTRVTLDGDELVDESSPIDVRA